MQYALTKNEYSKGHAVIVIRGEEDGRIESIVAMLSSISEGLDSRIEFKIGRLDESDLLVSFHEVLLAHNF